MSRLVATIESCHRWPLITERGIFRIACSCRRWSFTGNAFEIAAASRAHDDSPWTEHVVHVTTKVIEGRAASSAASTEDGQT